MVNADEDGVMMEEGEAIVPCIDEEPAVRCGKRAELELDLYASLATIELMSGAHEEEAELVKTYTEEKHIDKLVNDILDRQVLLCQH